MIESLVLYGLAGCIVGVVWAVVCREEGIKREIPRKGLFGMFDRLCEQAPIPRCQHCQRPVGAGNEIRSKVGGWGTRGGLITGCATCTPDRRTG